MLVNIALLAWEEEAEGGVERAFRHYGPTADVCSSKLASWTICHSR